MKRIDSSSGYDYSTLAADWRGEFPVAGRLVYLNHAAVAPLSRRAARAMQELAQDVLDYGSLHYAGMEAAYEGLRVAAARLIHAHRDEIAIVKNTSEGIATIAMGIDWRPGDAVVAFREEFPANYFPWKRLEARGIEVRWLSITDPLDRIADAARGARLLAISHVNYLSGYRVDLEAIGAICRANRAIYFVDAIQGLGAFPIDVEAAHIDALAADGHKWLLGPEGCGILYIRRELQDRVEPVEFGWTNIAGFNDYACRDMTLRPDAGRYECGTLNTIGIYGLRAAFELLLEVGVARISPAVLALTDRIARGVTERGFELVAPRTQETASGIVTFRKAGVDADALNQRLSEAGVLGAPRQGGVRWSPHFYVTEAEIDRALELLDTLAIGRL